MGRLLTIGFSQLLSICKDILMVNIAIHPTSMLSLLLIKNLLKPGQWLRGRISHRKASSAFTSLKKLPFGRQSCGKNQPINPDWSKPSSPTQSILRVWPSSWWDAWGSVQEPQDPQVPVGLRVWIWGQIVHLSAANFFKLFMNLNPSLRILLQTKCISSFHHILLYRCFLGKKLPLLAFLSCRTSVLSVLAALFYCRFQMWIEFYINFMPRLKLSPLKNDYL